MNQMGRAAGNLPSVSGRRSPVPILQVATGFWASQALLTAVELKVFTILFGGPKTAPETAQEAGADPAAMEALLDANCALGFLHRNGDRYRNDEVSNAYLVEGSPGSYVDLVRYMRDPLFGIWQGLADVVRQGTSQVPPEAIDGVEIALARGFHNGAYALMTRLAEILDIEFSTYSRMLDVGSHTGAGALCLARRYPQLHATLLDRPIFRSLAEEFIRSTKLEDRVHFEEGYTDEGKPGADYDLVLLSHHLSHRSRPDLPKVLDGVMQSLRHGGMLLVTEFLLEDSKAEPREAALFRLSALASYGPRFAGALTRSELYSLLEQSGFKDVDMVGLPMFGITAITACKA
ncbi:MAG TPA: methyltransferase dimerization domain-containing protein [Candidatus Limnocylindrales bacterium]|nr:methyltransferase dimerization domain-containing protein [Candidatus Limnocylindrales bacterium]